MARVRLLPALPLLVLFAAACAETPPPWPSPEQEAAATERGGAAADRLVGTLMPNLAAALDSAGPAGAIDFCSHQALVLTEQAAAGGVQLKRTTDRVRNPANAPDSLEAAALAWFADQLETTGALPQAWLQVEGNAAIRYYRPLVVNDLCVQCHGPVLGLDSAVVRVLGERYPRDQATGYLPGDLRGLIRVRIPREALEDGAG